MAQPTLTYGATTVTLQYPQSASNDAGMEDRHGVSLGGQSRIQRLYRKGTYTLHMFATDLATWEAIRVLLYEATVNNDFPTFTFDRWTDTAAGVSVVAQLGPYVPIAPGLLIGDFDLTLTQAYPY